MPAPRKHDDPQRPYDMAELLLSTLRFSASENEALPARWMDADTRGLIPLLLREGGELWLYRRLCHLGLNETSFAQSSFFLQLERVARKTVAQNMLVRGYADKVTEILGAVGIPVLPIKGIARIDLRLEYPFADCRATNDVDLLVPADRQRDAWTTLTEHGYSQASDNTPEGHYHLPPLAASEQVPVELHTSLSYALPPDEAWQRTARVQDATEILWQGWMHAMDQGLDAFSLRYYLDAAVALASARPISWDTIVTRLGTNETENRPLAAAWIRAAAYLSSVELPDDVLAMGKPFPLHRIYRWRIKAFRTSIKSPRWTRKLLSEAMRCEFGLPPEGPVPSTPVPHQIRRRISAVAARTWYLSWRALQRDNRFV